MKFANVSIEGEIYIKEDRTPLIVDADSIGSLLDGNVGFQCICCAKSLSRTLEQKFDSRAPDDFVFRHNNEDERYCLWAQLDKLGLGAFLTEIPSEKDVEEARERLEHSKILKYLEMRLPGEPGVFAEGKNRKEIDEFDEKERLRREIEKQLDVVQKDKQTRNKIDDNILRRISFRGERKGMEGLVLFMLHLNGGWIRLKADKDPKNINNYFAIDCVAVGKQDNGLPESLHIRYLDSKKSFVIAEFRGDFLKSISAPFYISASEEVSVRKDGAARKAPYGKIINLQDLSWKENGKKGAPGVS